MTTPFRQDGRVAMVTGGASGIGEATSRVFAAAGAAVLIADIDMERAENLAKELPGARAVRCDVTDEAGIRDLFAGLERLDVLVNNAGIGLVGTVEDTELVDFERLMRVNVTGPYLVTRFAMPHLLKSQGRIVNIGSVAGLIGVKKRFAYCATK